MLRLADVVSPTFRALNSRNYRLFRRRLVPLQHRHLAAAGRPGLAGPDPDRHAGAAVGITTGLQFLPTLLFSPFAGVLADRYPKRTVLNWTQSHGRHSR